MSAFRLCAANSHDSVFCMTVARSHLVGKIATVSHFMRSEHDMLEYGQRVVQVDAILPNTFVHRRQSFENVTGHAIDERLEVKNRVISIRRPLKLTNPISYSIRTQEVVQILNITPQPDAFLLHLRCRLSDWKVEYRYVTTKRRF